MKTRTVLAAALCMASVACSDTPVKRSPDPATRNLRVDALAETFRRIGYDLDSVRSGSRPVPRLLLAGMPAGLDRMGSVDERKAMFVGIMLPAILHANEEVEEDRRFVVRVRADLARGKGLQPETRTRLDRIADRYDVVAEDIDGILRRVDVVPVSLALAQAAIESGWGTSRFARQGRALFGQRTYCGDGMEPSGISQSNFRVRTFDHPADSVAAYLLTLNTHAAYEPFRALRADMRRRGMALDPRALAATLTRYSERGSSYVGDVRAVMRANRLESFDRARLDDDPAMSPS